MAHRDWRKRVEAATVRLEALGGQAVLVRGGVVLSATHCIEWDGSGGMTLGDHVAVPVRTADGLAFSLGPVFADALSDLMALGALDNQRFGRDWEAFEDWCEGMDALPLSGAFEEWCEPGPIGAEQVFEVHCLAHTGEWISGVARRFNFEDHGPRFHLETSAPIQGGTSGGPIVDNNGALVGVMSNYGTGLGGMQPVAAYALPLWLLRKIGGR